MSTTTDSQFSRIALTIAIVSACVGYFVLLLATLRGVGAIPELKSEVPSIAFALMGLGGSAAVFLPYASGYWKNKVAGRWGLVLTVFLVGTICWKTPIGHFAPSLAAWWWSGAVSLILGSAGIIAHPRMFVRTVSSV